jgi:RNA polymerase sigma factor (TIGR02999 family)
VYEDPGSITTLVNDIARGGARKGHPMVERLQAELESLARARMRTLGKDSEIRTGDLVNEAYLKLFAGGADLSWENRRHFFGAASRAMQQIIIDLARRLDVRRSHGMRVAVPIESAETPTQTLPLPVLLQLLDALDQTDTVAGEVLRMRIFAGLSVAEAAQVLGIPLRTAQRKWTIGRGLARAWLAERMDHR